MMCLYIMGIQLRITVEGKWRIMADWEIEWRSLLCKTLNRMDTSQQEIGELGAGIRKGDVNMKGWRVVWGVSSFR